MLFLILFKTLGLTKYYSHIFLHKCPIVKSLISFIKFFFFYNSFIFNIVIFLYFFSLIHKRLFRYCNYLLPSLRNCSRCAYHCRLREFFDGYCRRMPNSKIKCICCSLSKLWTPQPTKKTNNYNLTTKTPKTKNFNFTTKKTTLITYSTSPKNM